MSNFYLPVYDKDSKKNNIRIYNMEYNKETLKEFLEYVRILYQDIHLINEILNEEELSTNSKYCNITNCSSNIYKIDPVIYDIFYDVIMDTYLNLRPLGLYMNVNFDQKIPNNYTNNEKDKILLQLKKNESFAKDIHVSNIDKICNEIYLIEQAYLRRNLTISEKDMVISEFERLVVQFFDLFEIDEIAYKNRYSKYFDFETAIFNKTTLNHDALQKVYKKFF